MKVLCLRTVDQNHQSYDHFQWPKEPGSIVSAPDWNPQPECGNGLHGLLWGEGDGSLLADNPTAIWQVVEVSLSEVVEIDQKVKFPSCTLIYSGTKEEATALIKQRHPEAIVCFANVSVGDRKVAVVGFGGFATAGNGGTATAGYGGTATAGHCGTAMAGHCGTATAGDSGTATAGYRGTATAGNYGTATAGHYGTATAGYRGTATAGNYGTATAGHYGTATAGHHGTATAGNGGTATAGDGGIATAGNGGTATAGHHGTATAGENGEIRIRYWDRNRYRTVCGCIGENGLEPNVKYFLDRSHHHFLKV